MNDKKYSPGTSETEELIDGSFRSAVNYIVSLVKSWKLNPLQRTLAIISAVSSLFLLINLNGQIYIWMCVLAGLLQLWMCVKKVKVESFSMAFTYSLFSVGSLITAIQQIINYGGYYFSGWRGAERVIVNLVLYALVAMAWVLALKKDESKNTLRLVFFIISCVFGAYEVIYVLLALRTSFKLALYGLAWIGFIAVFAIQVFLIYRKNAQHLHLCMVLMEVQVPSIHRCRIIRPRSRRQVHRRRSSRLLYQRQHRVRILRRKWFSVLSAVLVWIAIPCFARNAVQDLKMIRNNNRTYGLLLYDKQNVFTKVRRKIYENKRKSTAIILAVGRRPMRHNPDCLRRRK